MFQNQTFWSVVGVIMVTGLGWWILRHQRRWVSKGRKHFFIRQQR